MTCSIKVMLIHRLLITELVCNILIHMFVNTLIRNILVVKSLSLYQQQLVLNLLHKKTVEAEECCCQHITGPILRRLNNLEYVISESTDKINTIQKQNTGEIELLKEKQRKRSRRGWLGSCFNDRNESRLNDNYEYGLLQG